MICISATMWCDSPDLKSVHLIQFEMNSGCIVSYALASVKYDSCIYIVISKGSMPKLFLNNYGGERATCSTELLQMKYWVTLWIFKDRWTVWYCNICCATGSTINFRTHLKPKRRNKIKLSVHVDLYSITFVSHCIMLIVWIESNRV